MGNSSSTYFFTYSSAVDGPEFDYNPNYNQERLHSDYTLFYLGIGICAAIAIILLVINVLMGCCSPWRKYWMSRFSGNRLARFQ